MYNLTGGYIRLKAIIRAYQKVCKIETLLLQTSNNVSDTMAYQIAQFPGLGANASVFRFDFLYRCPAADKISTKQSVARSLCDS